jgi:hypothetical protein
MPKFVMVQNGATNYWINTDQVRFVEAEPGSERCSVRFDQGHVLHLDIAAEALLEDELEAAVEPRVRASTVSSSAGAEISVLETMAAIAAAIGADAHPEESADSALPSSAIAPAPTPAAPPEAIAAPPAAITPPDWLAHSAPAGAAYDPAQASPPELPTAWSPRELNLLYGGKRSKTKRSSAKDGSTRPWLNLRASVAAGSLTVFLAAPNHPAAVERAPVVSARANAPAPVAGANALRRPVAGS